METVTYSLYLSTNPKIYYLEKIIRKEMMNISVFRRNRHALESAFLFITISFFLNQSLCGYSLSAQKVETLRVGAARIALRVNKIYEELGYIITKNQLGATIIHDKKRNRNLDTGGGFHGTDLMLFLAIRDIFPARSIFIIGNAFGYSTFCLAEVFGEAKVDVIDAEIEGEDNKVGSNLTRKIAERYYPSVRLTIGFSPEDTPRAVRKEVIDTGGYELIFIDGLHTNDQIYKDFNGISPYLAPKCIVVIHDVGLANLQSGFRAIRERANQIRFNLFISRLIWTHFGTGLLARGFPPLQFEPYFRGITD
ncbi:MAG: class I SAM-dependent methyltransferase [Candidatus Aminicenantes bacterium]|nr:class I SAM-dependent methyltransferase [Candidatus Aminicenantes bacterium]